MKEEQEDADCCHVKTRTLINGGFSEVESKSSHSNAWWEICYSANDACPPVPEMPTANRATAFSVFSIINSCNLSHICALPVLKKIWWENSFPQVFPNDGLTTGGRHLAAVLFTGHSVVPLLQYLYVLTGSDSDSGSSHSSHPQQVTGGPGSTGPALGYLLCSFVRHLFR